MGGMTFGLTKEEKTKAKKKHADYDTFVKAVNTKKICMIYMNISEKS